MRALFVFFLIAILFASCTRNKGYNVLKKAEVEKHFNGKGELTAVTYSLNNNDNIKSDYLYLRTKQKNIRVVLNRSVDTISFEKIAVNKFPFNDVRIVHQNKMRFKLIDISEEIVDNVCIVLSKPIKEDEFNVMEVKIVSRNAFNNYFNSCDEFVDSDISVLKINSDTTIGELKQAASIEVYNKRSYKTKKNKPDYIGDCNLKIRGQTSKSFRKKGFKLELTDSVNRNIPLLGMPKEKDWVLHGPYNDVSLIRNVFAYDLSNKLGQYAPRTRFCELVLNNEYLGVYVLIESIKPDKNRVNFKKLKDKNEHINTFMVKIDKGSGPIFKSPYKSMIDSGWIQSYYAVYPKKKNISYNNLQIIKKHFVDFESSFLVDDWQVDTLVDWVSFVDYFIVNELARNIDAYRLSSFMHIANTGKLKMGPVWDFNYSLGLTKHDNGYKTQGWVVEGKAIPFWWKKLYKNEHFNQLLQKRWIALRSNELSWAELNNTIDSLANLNEPARYRNFQKWKGYGDKLMVRYNKAEDYDAEIELIKDWLKLRLVWMDENIIR